MASLLALEIETVYGPFAAGHGDVRLLTRENSPRLVYAWNSSESFLAVSRPEIAENLDWQAHQRYAPDVVPDFIAHLGAPEGGPSFLFPDDLSCVPTEFPIVVSDRDRFPLNRPGDWAPDEWGALLAGQRGPWAMALDGAVPVAICHTPVWTDRSAEAGLWTAPTHRGRGLGPAVAAAWHGQAKERWPILFYSTFQPNTASRRVAQKLNLKPLGWFWRIDEKLVTGAPGVRPIVAA